MRRVEVSNRQQTHYFGHHEKAPVGRGRGDRAVVVQGQGERETVGQLRLAQPERNKLPPLGWKRFRAEEIKELAVERNIPIGGPNGKPQVNEALTRDLLRWCKRDRPKRERRLLGSVQRTC